MPSFSIALMLKKMRISSNAHRGPCHLWCALNLLWLTWTSYFLYFKEINKNPVILIIPTATIPFKYNSKYTSQFSFSTCTSAQPTSYEKCRAVFQWLSPNHFPLAVESSVPSDCLLTYPAPKYHPNDPLSRVNRDLSIFPNVCLKAEHETQLCTRVIY